MPGAVLTVHVTAERSARRATSWRSVMKMEHVPRTDRRCPVLVHPAKQVIRDQALATTES
jgi:hypothetical protein